MNASPLLKRIPHGHLDKVANGRASGWVAFPDSGQVLEVMLTIDGRISGVTRADRARPDLLDAGYHDGGHGFELPIPTEFQDGLIHKVEIFTAGFPTPLHSLQSHWRIGTTSSNLDGDSRQFGEVDQTPLATPTVVPEMFRSLQTGKTNLERTVLFYVEPVTFRNDPSMFMTWAEWVRCIAEHNQTVLFVIVSSSYICSNLHMKPDNLDVITVNGLDFLSHHRFELEHYVDNLHHSHESDQNLVLEASLKRIADDVDPNIVISFSENPYLHGCFKRSDVIFSELGTLPQHGVPASLFFDRLGHQGGLLHQQAEAIAELEPPLTLMQADDLWRSVLERNYRSSDLYKGAREWLASLRARHLILAVLQPPDHPNYSDFRRAARPVEMLSQIADDHPDSLVIPTFHRNFVLDERYCVELGKHFSNVRFPPRSLGVGRSEMLVEMVDQVVTLSSSVGFTALLHGVPTRSLARSRYDTLTHYIGTERHSLEHRKLRRNLLAVFSNGYLHRLDELLSKEGYFTQHVVDVLPNERLRMLNDFDRWRIEDLERLLGC